MYIKDIENTLDKVIRMVFCAEDSKNNIHGWGFDTHFALLKYYVNILIKIKSFNPFSPYDPHGGHSFKLILIRLQIDYDK